MLPSYFLMISLQYIFQDSSLLFPGNDVTANWENLRKLKGTRVHCFECLINPTNPHVLLRDFVLWQISRKTHFDNPDRLSSKPQGYSRVKLRCGFKIVSGRTVLQWELIHRPSPLVSLIMTTLKFIGLKFTIETRRISRLSLLKWNVEFGPMRVLMGVNRGPQIKT